MSRYKIMKYASDRTHDSTEINYEFTADDIEDVMAHVSAFLKACGYQFEVETETQSDDERN